MDAEQRSLEPEKLNFEQRRDKRVSLNSKAKLSAKGIIHGWFPVKNLSVSGFFLEGDINIPAGEDCCLEFYETGENASLVLSVLGKIIRRDEHGLGVAFTAMENDCFMLLQTIVLYYSDAYQPEVEDKFQDVFKPHPKVIATFGQNQSNRQYGNVRIIDRDDVFVLRRKLP